MHEDEISHPKPEDNQDTFTSEDNNHDQPSAPELNQTEESSPAPSSNSVADTAGEPSPPTEPRQLSPSPTDDVTPSETLPTDAPPMHPNPTIPPALPPGRTPMLKSKKFWLYFAILVIVIVVLVIVLTSNSNTPQSSLNLSSPAKTNSALSTSATPAKTLPAGTDNSSLNGDLNNINSTMNQEKTDQSGATSALNDSSQQITIPTN